MEPDSSSWSLVTFWGVIDASLLAEFIVNSYEHINFWRCGYDDDDGVDDDDDEVPDDYDGGDPVRTWSMTTKIVMAMALLTLY